MEGGMSLQSISSLRDFTADSDQELCFFGHSLFQDFIGDRNQGLCACVCVCACVEREREREREREF
jgi:hypothetical protein